LLLLVTATHAQTSTSKKDLIARILVLQQLAIEQTAKMLVERPALQLQQQAGVALQTRVAPEKREAVAKQVQQDLKQYVDEVGPLVRQQAVKLAPSTIGTLLEERFTEDELKPPKK
jgi:NAD+--asparagine ADP-ribosyltransferase